MSKAQKDKLRSNAKHYVWDDAYLWKICNDQIIRRCVSNPEFHSIFNLCHTFACGGHFGPKRTTRKLLEASLYWPTLFKGAYSFCKNYEHCHRIGNISRRNEMPWQPRLLCEIFDVWIIDFMRPFSNSLGFTYILLVVDYVFKWVKAKNQWK